MVEEGITLLAAGSLTNTMSLTAISPGTGDTSSRKWKLFEEGIIILTGSSLTNTMSLTAISPGNGDTTSQRGKLFEERINILPAGSLTNTISLMIIFLFDHNLQIEITIYNSLENQI